MTTSFSRFLPVFAPDFLRSLVLLRLLEDSDDFAAVDDSEQDGAIGALSHDALHEQGSELGVFHQAGSPFDWLGVLESRFQCSSICRSYQETGDGNTYEKKLDVFHSLLLCG